VLLSLTVSVQRGWAIVLTPLFLLACAEPKSEGSETFAEAQVRCEKLGKQAQPVNHYEDGPDFRLWITFDCFAPGDEGYKPQSVERD
jgi:hypothetical protein